MLTLSVRKSFPDELSNRRAGIHRQSLIRAISSRMRPRMNELAQDLAIDMKYKKLAPYFRVHQKTEEGHITLWIENTHPMAGVLLNRGGTPPHIIRQEPHVIPRFKLFNWAVRVGAEDPAWLAGFAQARIATPGRELVIPHPGTAEDEPLWQTVDSNSDLLAEEAGRAAFDWAERVGYGYD